jgi:hypothetical protein
VEQEPEEQPAQADEDFVWCSTPDMPKVDGSFSSLWDAQDGHVTDTALPNVSFSNFVRHLLQRYSKIGIAKRSQVGSYLGTSISDRGQLPAHPHGTSMRPGPSATAREVD